MISFSPKITFANQTRIKVECRLDQHSGQQSYLIGDRLVGKLTLTPSKTLPIKRITGELGLLVKSAAQSGMTKVKTVVLANAQTLKEGEDHHLNLLFIDEFDFANFSDKLLDCSWRFTVEIHLQKPEKATLNTSVKSLFGDYRPASVEYRIPVSRSKGHYRVKAHSLPIRGINTKYNWGMAVTGVFIIWLLFIIGNDGGQLLSVIHYLVITAIILGTTILQATLSGFQSTPLSVKPMRDGALRIRMFDLGKRKYDNLIIGYRLVSVRNDTLNNSELRRSILHDRSFVASSITRPGGLFREAVLPWPKQEFPGSLQVDDQRYTWEVYLRTNVAFFGSREQSWPVEVDWVSLGPTVLEGDQSPEDALERLPLKEELKQPR